ncbi:MAG: protein kinase [Clostridia bacterium]|nr:protein kinase [Clostridia bacterium]
MQFEEWQKNNKYSGKRFSVLGDSISTLEGFNPKDYCLYYTGELCDKTDVREMKDTWWGQVIEFLGGELLVNNSWSGCRVTRVPGNEALFPSGCCDERTSALHVGEARPDVILIYLGTNDWGRGASVNGEEKEEQFGYAYEQMLNKLKKNYPEAELLCCTLPATHMTANPSFVFPHSFGGIHIDRYNEIIKRVASERAGVLDLASFRILYDTVDGTHPNKNGMNTLSMLVLRAMVGRTADPYLDCPNDNHEYQPVEEYTGGTKYICRKCGKENHVSTLTPNQQEVQAELHDEYVLLPPGRTARLYPNTLQLTVERSGEKLEFSKNEVHVGREIGSDLFFGSQQSNVGRKHATFFYEKDMWLLRDDHSKNGTWLNGVKMQPGKRYQLAAGDVIDFARAERFVFAKEEPVAPPQEKPVSRPPRVPMEPDKALAFLEKALVIYARSLQQDESALKMILSALPDAPLYLPVEVDASTVKGKDKSGVRMRVITMRYVDGSDIVPLFTSKEEARKGQKVSVVQLPPQKYIPLILPMKKAVAINPFGANRAYLKYELLKEHLASEQPHQTSASQPPKPPMPPRGGAAPMVSHADLVGTIVEGKYRVVRPLGFSGNGEVYMAYNEPTDTHWVLKYCDKAHPAYNPAMRDALLREGQIMRALQHPAIPRVAEIVENDRQVILVREFADGPALDALVRERGPQSSEAVMDWGRQLCGVLQYMHSMHPIHVHRDIKPANVVLVQNRWIKLIDFGIVWLYNPNQKGNPWMVGTRGYAAPEQFDPNAQPDPRADIYGLGMTLYYLATGSDPTALGFTPIPVRRINPALSEQLERVIMKCLEPNPANRFQSCYELMDALNGKPF